MFIFCSLLLSIIWHSFLSSLFLFPRIFFLTLLHGQLYYWNHTLLQVHSTSDGKSADSVHSDFPGGEAAQSAINYSSRHRSPSPLVHYFLKSSYNLVRYSKSVPIVRTLIVREWKLFNSFASVECSVYSMMFATNNSDISSRLLNFQHTSTTCLWFIS